MTIRSFKWFSQMQKTLYVLLAFFICASSLYGQRLEKFSDDQSEFLKQLEEYMTASKRKALEETYEEFAGLFNSGLFNDEEKLQILSTGNAMLAQRMVASPYFKNYLKALTVIKNSSDPERHFKEWHTVLGQVLQNIENRHLKPFDEFVEFSMLFFGKGALRYSKSGGTSWYAIANDFEFDYVDGEPVISFDKVDLMANRRTDTIFIYGTTGSFQPVDRIWKGKAGIVTWERHGLGKEVYAELEDYEFEMISSLYNADAMMHYPTYFGNKSVKGTFSDKLVARNDATGGSFPRFQSFERLEIKNIGEGVYYEGGFRLHGTTVYGFGTKEDNARISISAGESQAVFNGASELFTIRKGERIAGNSVEGVLYFGQDSIYHPSVNVDFRLDGKRMILSRGDRASDRNPFFSSMHKINLFADNITAYMDGDSIAIGREKLPLKTKPDVVFESFNYFKERDYQSLQNIATVNPIAALKILYDDEGRKYIPAIDVAKKLNPRFGVENIKSLLYDMVSRGFINYDSEKEEVEIKDKVLLYADAHLKKTDYDVLKISSKFDSTNAVMNLKDKTIDMRGVRQVEFSEKQKVAVLPEAQRLIMSENRDMDFDGKVYAGMSTLEGKDFHFKYGPFHIDLDSVRYFDLFVPSDSMENGKPLSLSIGSRIEHVTGVLLIDAPSNKSGKDEIPMFPSLQSKDISFVFYDYKSTQKGAYTRDSFYFQLTPFSFNHLDYYTREDVQFEGTLFSADIFPPFPEIVSLQEDESLGFITETKGEGGYPAYREKGKYEGELYLSNKGFLANGNVTYLGASIDSEDIIFMPKQMLASADRFDLEENRTEGEEVPQVKGLDVKIDWRPYQDSMYIRSEEAAFALFQEGQHTLDGTLILTPGGLKGVGVFDWETATMESKLFAFGAFSSTADTTKVKIKTQDLKDIALSTKNVRSDVDFDEQLATFEANEEYLETILPAIEYKTSMNEFTWDMAEETIVFKSDPNKPGRFVSTHPDKDSLFFEGGDAFYDLKEDLLKVSGVPFILAADAFIYADSNYLEIERGGEMATLENAQIVADTINKYHVINKAKVNVEGRRNYTASGFYQYDIGDRKQEIEFENIIGQPVGKGNSNKDKPAITKGTGDVKPDDNLYIDHKTKFQGTITLSADSKNLSFDGFAKLDAASLPHQFWFAISSKADKNNLAISYNEPKTYEGEPTNTGFFLSKETAEMYPRVMAPLFSRKDRPILPTPGLFTYNPDKDIFLFGDSLRVLSGTTKGNMLTFYNGDRRVIGTGKFNIGSGLKYVSVEASGILRSSFPEKQEEGMQDMIVSDTASLVQQTDMEEPDQKYQVEGDIMAGVKLEIPNKLLNIMLNEINQWSFDAPNIIYLTELDFYRPALINLLPEGKEKEEALSTLGSGLLSVDDKINNYTFLFAKIPMKWNAEYQSLVSQTSKLGIISINGEPLNKKLEAYVEFKMPSNEDDRMYIYIKSPGGSFYYYGFKQGILSVTSDNVAFMDALGGMKSKELIMKMDDGNTYEIQPVDVGTARFFLNRVKAAQK
jgi:hypothetical protein